MPRRPLLAPGALAAALALALPASAAAPAPAAATSSSAAERTGVVRVEVTPDREDWTYALGAPVGFTIRVRRDGHPIPGAVVRYRIGLERLPPTLDAKAPVPADGLRVEAAPLAAPGFLRCEAEVEVAGRTYKGLATAGFAPHAIQPTVENPADFDAFWAGAKKDLAAVPVAAKVVPLPERATAGYELFHVSVANVAPKLPRRAEDPPPPPSQIEGILCEPRGKGPFPAVLEVPGAGIRGYRGQTSLCERGFITLQIGIHGLPVTLDPGVYDDLGKGALSGYAWFGLDDRDRYFYRRVYLGAVRANDFLARHPKWDGKNLGVIGGSQGGALAIVTAALDPRVRALVSYYPALSDLTGYLHGRAGGWPHLFRTEEARTADKLRTAQYYDVVNFARRVKAPGLYSWGWNDDVCPPTSLHAAYNVVPGPKRLLLALETGHFTTKEQVEAAEAYLEEALKPAPRRAAPAGRPSPAPSPSPPARPASAAAR
jgi:cephalosporin-C deacetylase-like acetyl esterase